MKLFSQLLCLDSGLLVAAALSFLAISFWSRLRQAHHAKMPPGPRSLPLIGHLHLLRKKDLLPHESLAELSRLHGPIMFLRLGVVPTVVATSTGVALEFLKTNDRSCASRPQVAVRKFVNPDSIAWADYGPRFRSMRKVCVMEMLTPKRVGDARGIRADGIQFMLTSLLEENREQGLVKIMPQLTILTMNAITEMSLGKKFFGPAATSAEATEFKRLLQEFFSLVSATMIEDYIPYFSWLDIQGYRRRMRRVRQQFDEFLENIVEQHRRNQVQDEDKFDFVDVLLRAASPDRADSEHFSGGTIKALIQDMIVAGTEATSSTVEWSLVELIRNPSVQQKAQEEIDSIVGRERRVSEDDLPKLKYVQAIFNEALRLHPPAPLMLPHEVTEDITVSGYEIPKGWRVIINLYAIFRDEAAWSKPLEFKPERFLSSGGNESFVMGPFGIGRRACPGALLGLTTAHMAIASLLQCFSWSSPSGREANFPLEAVVSPRFLV